MFKYYPKNPESVRSILAAAFRLYFASFIYSLALSVLAAFTMSFTFYYLTFYVFGVFAYFSLLPTLYATLVTLIFFIPLVKRIYSIGAGLPISTKHAFDGFISHYIRMTLLMCLFGVLSILMDIVWDMFDFNNIEKVIFFSFLVVMVIIFTVKVYFTPMYIMLENKNVYDAIKSSFKIEFHHSWLTFSVLFVFFIGYSTVVSFTEPYIAVFPFGLDIYTILLSVVAFPLIICIQMTQFFNLKDMTEREAQLSASTSPKS